MQRYFFGDLVAVDQFHLGNAPVQLEIHKAILRGAADMIDRGLPVTRLTLYYHLRTEGVIHDSPQEDNERYVMGFIHLNTPPLDYLSEVRDLETGRTVTHKTNGQSVPEVLHNRGGKGGADAARAGLAKLISLTLRQIPVYPYPSLCYPSTWLSEVLSLWSMCRTGA